MKIKQEELERLANSLLGHYRSKELINTKAADAEIKKRIVAIVNQNFADEEALEAEARKLLAGHTQASRDIDQNKMFLLAKQRLAAKKGFVL